MALFVFWIVGRGQLFEMRYAWSDYLTLQDAFKSADDAACLKYSYSSSTHKVAGSFDELKGLTLQAEGKAFTAQFLDVGFHASKLVGFLTMFLRQCKDFARPCE